MNEISEFIRENLHTILMVTFVIVTLLVVLNIFDVKLNDDKTGDVSKIVTVEALKNHCSDLPYLSFTRKNFQIGKNKSKSSDFSLISFSNNSFCHNNSEPGAIDKFCSISKKKDLCTSNVCCGWLNDNECVGGNKEGPFFQDGADKRPLKIKSYQHMGNNKVY